MSARELLVLLGMCLVWGLHFVVIKVGVEELPPMFYGALRMTLVAVLLSPFLRWRPGAMKPVFAAGLCLGGLNYAFMFNGVKLANATSAAIAMELYVPFAAIMSVMFLNETIGWRRIVAIALAFIGVAIIAIGGEGGGEARLGLGVGVVAMGAFVEAAGAILVKKTRGFRPMELLAWFAVIGTLALWALTLAFESGQGEAIATADRTRAIGAILYSAIAASIIGHGSYYWLLQRLPVGLVAPSALLTTVIAVFAGVLIMDDPFTAPMIAGGLMVLSGVGVVIWRTNKKDDPDSPALKDPTPA